MTTFDWLVAGGSIVAAIAVAYGAWLYRERKLPVLTDEAPEHRYPSLANRDVPRQEDPPTTYTRKKKRNPKKSAV